MTTENTELALLPPRESALTVYSAANGLDPYLAQIRAEIDAFLPDVSTKKGRDAIASIAYKVAKSKTALDNLGKDLVAELKEVPKLIDAERKRMRDLLDSWKDEVRKPLTEYEECEAERIRNHENAIQWFSDMLTCWSDSTTLREVITQVESRVVDSSFEEFESRAHREKDDALKNLKQRLSEREKYEEEQAELARLRAEASAREQKEREERIAREAAENARIAAEKAAADERQRLADEQARKDLEAKAAIERAEREKVEAENARLRQEQQAREAAAKAEQDRLAAIAKAEADKQAAIEAERCRFEQEQAAVDAEVKRRERDTANRKRVNNEILADLLAAGISEEVAKLAITAIAKGQIRNVKINY